MQRLCCCVCMMCVCVCDVYRSIRSSLSCRPCGSVTSSRPEDTPIWPLSSGVTPSILATWRKKTFRRGPQLRLVDFIFHSFVCVLIKCNILFGSGLFPFWVILLHHKDHFIAAVTSAAVQKSNSVKHTHTHAHTQDLCVTAPVTTPPNGCKRLSGAIAQNTTLITGF